MYYDKFKKLCDEKGVKPGTVSRATGIPSATFSEWKKGTYTPKQDKLKKIAEYFEVSIDELMEENPEKKSIIRVYHSLTPRQSIEPKLKPSALELFAGTDSLRISKKIPVLGRVAAGIPIEANEEVIDYLEISGEMALNGDYFGLIIDGDSMEPRICKGDIAIVRKQDDADEGDTVIALVNGHDATCKKLKKYKDGIALVSLNPAYEPMYFSASDIEEVPVRILGKVVEFRAKKI